MFTCGAVIGKGEKWGAMQLCLGLQTPKLPFAYLRHLFIWTHEENKHSTAVSVSELSVTGWDLFFFLLTLSDSGIPSAPFPEPLGPGSKSMVEIWADINSAADTSGAKYKLQVLKSGDMFHCTKHRQTKPRFRSSAHPFFALLGLWMHTRHYLLKKKHTNLQVICSLEGLCGGSAMQYFNYVACGNYWQN